MKTSVQKFFLALATLPLCLSLCGHGQGALAEDPSLSLYPAYAEMPVGFTVHLDCRTTPANQALVWSSSDPAVASVDSEGRVRGEAEGEAVITATLADQPQVTASCGVRVMTDAETVIVWDDPPLTPPIVPTTPGSPGTGNDTPDNPPPPEPPQPETPQEPPTEIVPEDDQTEIQIDRDKTQDIREKDYAWAIRINGSKHGVASTTYPGYIDTYTMNFTVTKRGTGGDMFGTYTGTGSLRYSCEAPGVIEAAQGEIYSMGLVITGPLSDISFELSKPAPEPETLAPLVEKLAPLVPEGTPGPQAVAKSTMTWNSTMSLGVEARDASLKLPDTKTDLPVSFTIDIMPNGNATLFLEGATPEGQLLFHGTVTKQVVWKKVK